MQVMIREAGEADLEGILEIVNDAILNSTAIFSHHTVTLENRRAWFRDRVTNGFPVLVAILGGSVAGFASFGSFRPHDGYLHTVEHSVYVHRHHHGKGIGKQLMVPLVESARALGKHVAGGAGFVSNLLLWSETGYFDTAAEFKPLLHLWSLGIEEQFYILWPVLFLLLSPAYRASFVAGSRRAERGRKSAAGRRS